MGENESVKLRILVVDNSPAFAWTARVFLAAQPWVDVVHRLDSGETALRLVDDLDPDVVIVETRVLDRSGMDTTRILKRRRNPPTVILVADCIDDGLRVDAAEAGAEGLVTKSDFETDIACLCRR